MGQIPGRTRWRFLAIAGVLALGAFVRTGVLAPLVSANYLPHRYCYLARPGLVWSNVVADGLIAAAYALIFSCLLWVWKHVRGTPELHPYLWIFLSFATFIAACGATHAMEIVTVWWPVYPLSTAVKFLCAAVSVPTAIVFARTIPLLIRQLGLFCGLVSSAEMEGQRVRAEALDVREQLRESEEKFGFALVAASGIGTWEWDVASNLFRSDATVAQLYGVDPVRAVEGVPLEEYMQWIRPADAARVADSLATSRARQVPFIEEYPIEQPGNSANWVACRGQGTYAPDGTLLRMSGVVVDISVRKWVEQELQEIETARAAAQESEEMLRETEENLRLAFAGVNGVGTWEWDLRRDLIFSDAVFAEFYGVAPERAEQGAPFADFARNIPAEDLAVMQKLVETSIQTGCGYSMEHRVIQADGSVRWAAARARCKYDAEGTPLRFPGVVIDITERRQIEQDAIEGEKQKNQAIAALVASEQSASEERAAAATRLAETKGRFQLLVEGLRDHALVTMDTEGNFTTWNRGAERLLGYREEEIVGRHFRCLFTPEDIQNGVPETLVEEARRTGQANNEGWRLRADGQPFWANVTRTAFLDQDGAIAGFAVIIQDATERKRVATVLEETTLERSRLQERFLSHVSHELRTPLTAIYFFTSNVADGLFGELTADQREHLQFALQNVNQLKGMVSDLLDLTRVDTYKLSIEPQHVRPAQLAFDAMSTCLTNATAKKIKLEFDIDATLPAVWADPFRIRQILINLIDNGVKFTPEGGEVMIRARRYAGNDTYLCFSVTDNGCGIDPAHTEVIFNRLAQVDTRMEQSRSGLGLGLFISKELVAGHGGQIWVESELNRGSTFCFTVPFFSLARLCAHVMTPHNLAVGCATLIAVDIVASGEATRAEQLCEVHKVLERCVHPGQDVLLPGMGDLAQVMTFFIVACTDDRGFSVIANRIGMELKTLGDTTHFRPAISSTTVRVAGSLSRDEKFEEITKKFEGWITEHLRGQERFR